MAIFSKRNLVIIFLVGGLIGIYFKTAYTFKRDAEINNQTTVKIAAPRLPSSFLLILADKLDTFSRYNLRAEINYLPTDKETINELLQEKADFAISYEAPVALSLIHGHKLQVLTELHRSVESLLFLYRKDRMSDFNELPGKRVAITKGTNADYLLNIFLRMNNMKKSQVKILSMLPEEAAQMLIDGKVDAALIWEPFASQVRAAMKRDVGVFETSFYSETSMLVKAYKKQDYIDKKTESLILALIDAENFYLQNKIAAVKLVSKELNIEDNIFYKLQWDNFKFELALSHVLKNSLQDDINWYAKQVNLKPSKINHDIINTSYLKRLHPKTVTIE